MSEKTKSSMLLSLIEALDKWIEVEVEKEHWEEIGYCAEDLSGLMAKAAMLVIETNVAANEVERS